MYSAVRRDDAYRARLLGFLRQEYGIPGEALTEAPRGFFGETWRLEADRASYFVKADYVPGHQVAFGRSLAVVAALRGQGIDFVPGVVATADGRLSTRFDGAVVGVFDWIDGVNTESDDTKAPEYAMMARVYAADVSGLDIPREAFSGQAADRVFARWRRLAGAGDDAAARQACAVLERYRPELEAWAERLRGFAERCAPDRSGFVLTHGDAGGNLMTTSGGRRVIVDWDDPLLAPPERDAWCMCAHDWARALFTDALRRQGIAYELRPERLAYYIYHMCFHYLGELLDALSAEAPQRSLEEYLQGWVRERVEYADGHFTLGDAP